MARLRKKSSPTYVSLTYADEDSSPIKYDPMVSDTLQAFHHKHNCPECKKSYRCYNPRHDSDTERNCQSSACRKTQ